VRFLKNLYQGNQLDAIDVSRNGDFDVIVYVGQSIPKALTHYSEVPVIHIPLYDGKNPIEKYFWVLHNIAVGKTLLACQLGQSRSPSLVILFLVCYHGMSFSEAYDLVKRKVPSFAPNPELLESIKRFIREWRK